MSGHVSTRKAIIKIKPSEAQSKLTVPRPPPRELLWAAELGDVAKIRDLLAANVDVSNRDQFGSNALHLAVRNRHIDCIQPLVNGGIDINSRELATNNTALHLAAIFGRTAIIEKLLELGADVSLTETLGLTALHMAFNCRKKMDILPLLKAGADVNAKMHSGNTVLHIAAIDGDISLLPLLLASGADTTIKNDAGHIPLFCAAIKNHSHFIRALAAHGDAMASKILAELEEDIVKATQPDNSLWGRVKSYARKLTNRVPPVVKEGGVLLGQIGIFAAIPYLLDAPFETLCVLAGAACINNVIELIANDASIRKGILDPKGERDTQTVVDPNHEKMARDYVKDFSNKLGLADIELVIDDSTRLLDNAAAIPLAGKVFYNKSLFRSEAKVLQSRGVLAHEVSHLKLDKPWSKLGMKLSQNLVMVTNLKAIQQLFLGSLFVSLSPWRIPFVSQYFSIQASLLRQLLYSVGLSAMSKFLTLSRARDEENLADKGAVELTCDNAQEEFLTDNLLCIRARIASMNGAKINPQWLHDGWEMHKPAQTFLGWLSIDHPPTLDRIRNMREIALQQVAGKSRRLQNN